MSVDQLARFRKRWGPAADPATPYEEIDEGCPGAWYRCDFALSVAEYERTLMDSGSIPNIRLERCLDPFVIDAVSYLESERMRHRYHWQSKFNERR